MISKKELGYVSTWASKVPYPGIEKEIAMLNQKLNDLKAKEGKLNGEN